MPAQNGSRGRRLGGRCPCPRCPVQIPIEEGLPAGGAWPEGCASAASGRQPAPCCRPASPPASRQCHACAARAATPGVGPGWRTCRPPARRRRLPATSPLAPTRSRAAGSGQNGSVSPEELWDSSLPEYMQQTAAEGFCESWEETLRRGASSGGAPATGSRAEAVWATIRCARGCARERPPAVLHASAHAAVCAAAAACCRRPPPPARASPPRLTRAPRAPPLHVSSHPQQGGGGGRGAGAAALLLPLRLRPVARQL